MAFTANNDINILQASDSAVVGAGAGNDTYVLSPSTLSANQEIQISDTQGTNKLQLIGGLTIASSIVAMDTVQLTLSNGAKVTVLGASTFSYEVGGNPLTATTGTVQTYAQFATTTLGAASVPTTGTVSGTANVTIAGGSNGTYTLASDMDTVVEGKTATFTVTRSGDVTAAKTLTFNASGDTNNTTVAAAAAGVDASPASGTVTFAAGATTATFTVSANADTAVEGLEGLRVRLFDGTTAVADKVVLINDDTTGTTVPGNTFTLTVGEDKLTGTAGNDTFNGLIVQANDASAKDTLESFDVLDGGAGTDTLNATINSGTPAPVLKNIENVNLRFTAAKSVDLTSATGVTTIKVENSTAAGTVNGVGAVANLAVANQLKDVSFDSSTATTLALNLDTIANATGATQVKVDLGAATAAHKATTLNITANNANVELLDTTGTNVTTTLTVAATGTNTLKLTEAVKATTVTVTGTGSADLTGAAFTGNLTKFDASANEGGVKVDIQSAKAVAVTTGKGNDVIDMDTTVQNDSSVVLGAGNDTLYTGAKLGSFTKGVDGGEGTDIINITDGSKLDATTSKYITNFETLDVSGGKGDYDVSLNSFATVQIDEAIAGALADVVKFANAADTFTLNIASKAKTNGDFDVAKAITVVGKDYAGTTAKGDAETFTLVATLNDGNKDNGADGNIKGVDVTVANVENLVVQANAATLDGGTDALKASKLSLTAKLTADKAEVLTIKGDASVDLSSATTIGVVTKVDATGSTGNVTIDFTGHAKGVAYTGSEGVDTYKAGKAGDVIYTGKGADVVTLDAKAGAAGAVRDTFVLKAATDSQITDTSKDGKITLGGDTGFDEVIKFDSIGDTTPVANTSDRLDLTNFGFTGSQRGVADVSASVTADTNLTSIVDLFNTPAGDRGVAYTKIGLDSFVFVDANKDGNFTAADDLVIKLTGVGAVSETFINF